MRSIDTSAPTDVVRAASGLGPRAGLRGWLLVYMAGLVVLALHGLGLTVAVVVIYANPSLAGLTSFVPLGWLLFYVVTNVVLAIYTAVLLVLMLQHRKAAIANNIVFNLLSVLFVVLWHLVGEKSLVGTVVDSLPGLVGLGYVLISKRVRGTFVCSRRRGRTAGGPCPS
jgi:hypothetical protein